MSVDKEYKNPEKIWDTARTSSGKTFMLVVENLLDFGLKDPKIRITFIQKEPNKKAENIPIYLDVNESRLIGWKLTHNAPAGEIIKLYKGTYKSESECESRTLEISAFEGTYDSKKTMLYTFKAELMPGRVKNWVETSNGTKVPGIINPIPGAKAIIPMKKMTLSREEAQALGMAILDELVAFRARVAIKPELQSLQSQVLEINHVLKSLIKPDAVPRPDAASGKTQTPNPAPANRQTTTAQPSAGASIKTTTHPPVAAATPSPNPPNPNPQDIPASPAELALLRSMCLSVNTLAREKGIKWSYVDFCEALFGKRVANTKADAEIMLQALEKEIARLKGIKKAANG